MQIVLVGEQHSKFPLGQLMATPNARDTIPHEEIVRALSRHLQGDWGEMEQEDIKANNDALQNGGRLFSGYNSAQDVRFWIITEADRSYTTILLPEDY